MNRRTALLALVSTLLAKVPVAAQGRPGFLTVPLDQWTAISFTLGKERVTIPVRELFDTVKELP